MKRIAIVGAFMLGAFLAQAAEPKEEVIAAAKKLAASENYSFKQTSEGGNLPSQSSEGQVAKDGTIYISSIGSENLKTETIVKGEKGAMKGPDGEWQSVAELESGGEGRPRFFARMMRNMKPPTARAEELVKDAKILKKEGDVFVGELNMEAAKKLMAFGGRAGPTTEIRNATVNIRFWIKDGVLSKYQYRTQGTVEFNGSERDIDRTTTIEMNKVGETKVVIPEAAQKKLS